MADAEAREFAGRFLVTKLELLHQRRRRAALRPCDEMVDRGRIALGDDLDRPVRQVADVTTDAEPVRLPLRVHAEADALDEAANRDMNSSRHEFAADCGAGAPSGPSIAAPGRNVAAGQSRSRRLGRSNFATRPVHPVGCIAPQPRPVSPWKYSGNTRSSRKCGS